MVTDEQVWASLDAARDEGAAWRVMDFRGRGCLAIRQPLLSLEQLEDVEATASFERHEFTDVATANRYIEWRAMKAALEEGRAIQKGAE